MWCHSSRLKPDLPALIRIGTHMLPTVPSVLYLGVQLDMHLSFSENVNRTCRSCFAMLRRIRVISPSLTTFHMKTLVSSLVLSRLDYCLSAHAGLPKTTLWRLQRILHAAVRIACGAPRYDHIQPLLRQLNWLPIQGRIEQRLGMIAFNCRSGLAPPYLSCQLKDVASVPGRRNLRSSTSRALMEPRTRCPTLGGRAFPSVAAKLWNTLPPSMTSIDLPFAFKNAMRTFFINKYLCEEG